MSQEPPDPATRQQYQALLRRVQRLRLQVEEDRRALQPGVRAWLEELAGPAVGTMMDDPEVADHMLCHGDRGTRSPPSTS